MFKEWALLGVLSATGGLLLPGPPGGQSLRGVCVCVCVSVCGARACLWEGLASVCSYHLLAPGPWAPAPFHGAHCCVSIHTCTSSLLRWQTRTPSSLTE